MNQMDTQISNSSTISEAEIKLGKLQEKADTIKRGTEIFDTTYRRLSSQIDRLEAVIADLRSACAERGVVVPELENAVNDLNKLRITKVKLDRYMTEISNDNNSLEKKVAMLSGMVELASATANIGNRG